MKTLLAADIGGTKTLLQLSYRSGEIILQQRYENSAFVSFETLLTDFFENVPEACLPVTTSCFAVAGPVFGNTAKVTNLPWTLQVDVLLAQFPISNLSLINDFVAIGHGVEALTAADLMTLQAGQPEPHKPRAIIGAGTGLGQAYMTPYSDGWHVWPTEGGHTDFAPLNSNQQQLFTALSQQWSHVSYERLISGMGLATIYDFFCHQAAQPNSLDKQQDIASQISLLAHQQDAVAVTTLQELIRLYGAQAGNLALTVLPKNGLYIAGGIAMKNLPFFQTDDFISAFVAKGRMQPLLETIPVYLITDASIGLKGASVVAAKALYNN